MKRYPDRGLHGRIVEELGQTIVNGTIRSGETIDLEQAARKADVSRTVMREAIRVLGGKGLVDARPKRGTFVLHREKWHLLDPDVLRWQFMAGDDLMFLQSLHEVRMMIEPAAAHLAAQRATPEDIAELRDALENLRHAESSAESVVEPDLRFHVGIINATHNELVTQLGVVISTGLAARDRYVHSRPITLRDALDAHAKVLHAIEAGDAAEARAAMTKLVAAAGVDASTVQSAG